MSFKTGDIIYIYGQMDEDGFYRGDCKGLRGLVPSNFLREAPEDKPSKPTTPREKVSIGSDAPSPAPMEKADQVRTKQPRPKAAHGRQR